MATQYLHPGDTLTLTAPSGGVTAKVPLIIGNLFVLPQTSALEGEQFAARISGVWQVPKATGFVATGGTTVGYWDVADGNINSDTGNDAVGIFTESALSGDTECVIKVFPPLWIDVSAAAARLDAVESDISDLQDVNGIVSAKSNAGVGDQVNLTDTAAHVFTEKTSVGAALCVADDFLNIRWAAWVDGVNATPQITLELLVGTTVVQTVVIATAAANDYASGRCRLKLTTVGASLVAEVDSQYTLKDGTVSLGGAVQKALAITASSTAGFDITLRATSDAGHESNLVTMRNIDHDLERASA